MKNLLKLVSVSVLFLLIGLSNTAFAQNELLFGQDHFYTVVFRGNGETITYAKIVLNNPNDTPLTDFTFEMPKVSPSEFVAFQQELSPVCNKYTNNDSSKPCIEYRDPSYSNGNYYYYGGGNSPAEYQKIQYTKSGNLYHLTLPKAVEPYKSTAIILSYAAMGYVTNSAGLYKFEFETLKVPSRITNIRVAVNVDSDLLLKGKQSEVNYSYGLNSVPSASMKDQSVANPELDKVVNQIGSYGAIVKEAKNLAPNESFSVNGEYAKSWFRLYFSSIVWTILIIVAIFAAVYFIARFFRNRRGGNSNEMNNTVSNSTSSTIASQKTGLLSVLTLSVSILSVALVIGLTYLITFLGNSGVFNSMGYNPTFSIIIFIAILLLYVLLILAPAVIVAMRHGWKSFLYVLLAEFIWFIIFIIIYFVLFQSGLTSSFFYRGGVVY